MKNYSLSNFDIAWNSANSLLPNQICVGFPINILGSEGFLGAKAYLSYKVASRKKPSQPRKELCDVKSFSN